MFDRVLRRFTAEAPVCVAARATLIRTCKGMGVLQQTIPRAGVPKHTLHDDHLAVAPAFFNPYFFIRYRSRSRVMPNRRAASDWFHPDSFSACSISVRS